MRDDRFIWLMASNDARSHRRMYALAKEIIGSDAATAEMHRAARRVVRTLEGVIDLPIADSRVLKRASQQFAKMVVALKRFTNEGATGPVFSHAPEICRAL